MTRDDEVENARLELARARESLQAAATLVDASLWNDAISRAYYAAFHAATALLFSEGLQARTHSGVHDLVYLRFVQPGVLGRDLARDFAALQRRRENADYSTTVRFDGEAAREELAAATRLVGAIDALLRDRGVAV